METSELIKLVEDTEKPTSMWEYDPQKNNGFFGYDVNNNLVSSIGEPIELSRIIFGNSIILKSNIYVPNEINKLVLLSINIYNIAKEGYNGYRCLKDSSKFSVNKECIVYINGGILFKDEETQSKLNDYFNVRSDHVLNFEEMFNHGGMFRLLGLKDLGHALQFVSKGGEWESAPGYAHLCLGHIPYKKE